MMQPNIENTLMTLMGNDPRFQRAVAMLKGKTPEQCSLHTRWQN